MGGDFVDSFDMIITKHCAYFVMTESINYGSDYISVIVNLFVSDILSFGDYGHFFPNCVYCLDGCESCLEIVAGLDYSIHYVDKDVKWVGFGVVIHCVVC